LADGKTVAVEGIGVVLIHNTESKKTERTFAVGTNNHAMTISSDGKWLATMSSDDVCIFDTTTGVRRRRFPEQRTAAFSPDAKRLALANAGTLRILDATSLKQLLQVRVPLLDGQQLAWSADGKTLIASAFGGLPYFLDTDNGMQRGVLLGLTDNKGIAVNAEGHYRGSRAGKIEGGLSVDEQVVYVVQTKDGQQTLTPAEFAHKFNWKNNPSRVRLLGR
jgi:hypothetical protein